eukprot:TRINITY_DN16605_c0_g1_i1.p1 TRINITY_DN16605_c0_g1~~TRINITY_DN16605_c0_g1_i1.p1  ORF type:complete len:403 (+),score=59.40 TRINITY_DN16605_c0_g1_i1:52-1209(+)
MSLIATLLTAISITVCKDSMDCGLNGKCLGDKCHCRPPWIGEHCQELDILPLDEGTGYHIRGNASWGGNVVFADGKYHLFAAEMANSCGLNDYGTNSQIIRAESTTPNGPFTFSQVVFIPFAHNPTIRQAPDGSFLIYFIGGSRSTPKNCSSPSDNFAPNISPIQSGISVARSNSVYGPWDTKPVFFDEKSVNNSKWLQQGFTNPSPHIFPNGTVTLAFQAQPIGKHYELIGVARAASWDTPYVLLTGVPVVKNDPDLCVAGMGEDPFLWQDDMGWHMLIHGMCPSGFINAVYVYSNDDCMTWRKSPIPPYSYDVKTTTGSRFFWRVERPQLAFSSYDSVTGFAVNATTLFNGVCDREDCLDNPGKRPNLNWQTWTIARVLNLQK